MKKKIILLSVGLFMGAVFFSSCGPKRGGIVPCPSHSQIDIDNGVELEANTKQL